MNIDAAVSGRGDQADCGELNLRTRLYSEHWQRGDRAREDKN